MLCCEHCCCLTLSCCGLALWQGMSGLVHQHGLVASAHVQGLMHVHGHRSALSIAANLSRRRCDEVPASVRRRYALKRLQVSCEGQFTSRGINLHKTRTFQARPKVKRRVSTIYRCGHPPVLNIIVRTPRAHVLPRLSICKKALRINQRSSEPLAQHPSIQEPIIDKYMHCHDTAHTANTRVWRQVPTAQ